MVNFEIRGTPENVSKEEIRSILQATSCVLEFHKMKPKMPFKNNTIIVKIIHDEKKMPICRKSKHNPKPHAIGTANNHQPIIELGGWIKFSSCFTTCIHELIHIYNNWDDSKCEKLTSTLTAKLKPTITQIYNILIDGVYQRAGYIAHTKISYKPKGEDFYDKSEWNIVEVTDKGKKYRKMCG